MKVLLISHGSTGDIFPLIRFGVALVEKRHTVTFATARLFKEDIQQAGLDYFEVPPEWERNRYADFMQALNRITHPLFQLIKIYKGALPFLEELLTKLDSIIPSHDVVVSSYMYPHYRGLARKHGKPFLVFYFCNNFIPSAEFPPEPLPCLIGFPKVVKQAWNRFGWWVSSKTMNFLQQFILGKTLAKCGVPLSKDWLYEPADLSLVSVSESLMGNREFMNDSFKLTGYLRWQAPVNNEIENLLKDFTNGEKVPVLNFGSVVFDNSRQMLDRFISNWPIGKKIIIQSGWVGFSQDTVSSNILLLEKVISHDQLFSFASCVIHHGGAGTTASVLHNGIPHVVVPHIADQHFFASEVKRLGVGLSLSKNDWPETLRRAVYKVEKCDVFNSNALRIQVKLRDEDGAKRAVNNLERLVHRE